MNTDEVCKMIDAITEGKEFTLSVPVPVGENSLTLKFHEDEISIYGAHGFATAIRNLRDIREIAAALVAWANRKDGTIDLAAMSILGSIRWAELKKSAEDDTAPSIHDWANIKSGRSTREEWYRRNVRHMTPETLKRNMKDLKEIKAQTPVGPEYDDIQKAIDILHVALNGGNIPPLPEGNDNV